MCQVWATGLGIQNDQDAGLALQEQEEQTYIHKFQILSSDPTFTIYSLSDLEITHFFISLDLHFLMQKIQIKAQNF